MDKLLEAGALDVFYTPIYMKKNRPAIKLTFLCSDKQLEQLEAILLKESTTIGLRKYQTERSCMQRSFIQVSIPCGIVNVKVSSMGEMKKYMPEYEDCKKIAQESGMPLREVYALVIKELS